MLNLRQNIKPSETLYMFHYYFFKPENLNRSLYKNICINFLIQERARTFFTGLKSHYYS